LARRQCECGAAKPAGEALLLERETSLLSSVVRKEGTMPGRKHTREEIDAKLRQVEQLTGQGRTLSEAIQCVGVVDATYYRWRKELGGLKVDQRQRLKDLEVENAELKNLLADAMLDNAKLKDPL
jgi:transposase-like protein